MDLNRLKEIQALQTGYNCLCGHSESCPNCDGRLDVFRKAIEDLIFWNRNTSVLQNWVTAIPIRMQSTLVLGLRGPDTAAMPKVKEITRWLRGLTFKPGNTDPTQMRQFMGAMPERIKEKSLCHKELEFCTLHCYTHLMHSIQVVAYRHLDCTVIGGHAYGLFEDMCSLLHLEPETAEHFEQRLCTKTWPSGRQPDDFKEALEILGLATGELLFSADGVGETVKEKREEPLAFHG